MSHFVLVNSDSIEIYNGPDRLGQRLNPSSETAIELSTEAADWVAETIFEAGLEKKNWALGLPGSFVFFSDLLLDESLSQSTNSIAYALEEHLPIEAEQMIPCLDRNKSTARLVTLNYSTITSFIDRLYVQHDIVFYSVTATSLTIAEYLVSKRFLPTYNYNPSGSADSSWSCLSLETRHQNECFVFQDRHLSQWKYSIAASPDSFKRTTPGCLPCDETVRVCRNSEVDSNTQQRRGDLGQTNLPIPLTNSDSATMTTGDYQFIDSEFLPHVFDALAKGKFESPFDFASKIKERIGARESKTDGWEMLAAAVLLSIILFSMVLFFRGQQWERVALQHDQSNRQAFKKLFPEKRINGPISKILATELKRQNLENDLVVYSNQTANLAWNTQTLFKTLQSIPEVKLQNLTLSSEKAVVKGTAEAFASLDKLKSEFKRAGYEIGAGSSYALSFELFLTRSEEAIELADANIRKAGK